MDDEQLFGGELERVRRGADGTPPEGLRSVRAHVVGDPHEAVARAREVLTAVLANLPRDWPDNEEEPFPSVDAWASLLPNWFVDLCGPETTEDKVTALAHRLGRLPAHVRQLVSDNTAPSLDAWIDSFETFRAWLWWDVTIERESFVVRHVVFDWAYTKWTLSWLLVASGAWKVEYSESLVDSKRGASSRGPR